MIFYSFILPAYKAEFLDKAIVSILNQSYKNFELVIIDDASPYNLHNIVEKYLCDHRVRYEKNIKNIGGDDLVAQWNHCINYAKGEYLILASDDDVYEPNYLEAMDKLVNKYPTSHVFRPRVQEIDEFDKVRSFDGHLKEYLSQIEFTYKWIRCEVKRYIPEYVFKTVQLKSIGGFVNFPLAWFSDDATVIKLSSNGLVCCDEVLFSFRNSGINISSNLNNVKHLKGKLQATADFYKWFVTEIETMDPKGIEESELHENIMMQYRYRKIDHMAWLICNSNVKAFFLSPLMLCEITTLPFMDKIRVICQVIRRKISI